MDRAALSKRIQKRIVDRLALAGPAGQQRTALIESVYNRHTPGGYRRSAEELDQMHGGGVIIRVDAGLRPRELAARVGRRYRLDVFTVDEIAYTVGPDPVSLFYDLTQYWGREFRQRRIDMYSGFDIAVSPYGRAKFRPPYTYRGWSNLTDEQLQLRMQGDGVEFQPGRPFVPNHELEHEPLGSMV